MLLQELTKLNAEGVRFTAEIIIHYSYYNILIYMMIPAASASEASSLSRDEVKEALRVANVPALLMLLYQATGDERWLKAPYLPKKGRGLDDNDSGGLPEATQDEVRRAAEPVVLELQAGARPVIEVPSPTQMVRMTRVYLGEEIGDRYGPMLSAELARRLDLEADPPGGETLEIPANFSVIVIGAGVAGIVAAKHLEDLGIDYQVIERQPDAGGVWSQTRYPGAGVDTPSHLYSFSFAHHDWGKHFELRNEIQRYFAEVLRNLGAERRVRFDTEVRSATFDPDAHEWVVEVRSGDRGLERLRANVVISAAGALNEASIPELPGLASFEGVSVHSSQWPEDLSLDGKRVALVGTGASAMQIAPAIADRVSELTIFQRSPAWVAPFEKFGQPIPPPLRRLLETCAIYRAWYWLRLFWQFGDPVIKALRRDPDWPHPERSMNPRNDAHRKFFTHYIEEQLEGDEELIEKTLPDYPPFGKRILLDNGWYRCLLRDNVNLVAEAVREVGPHGLTTESGEYVEADVIIWATGFKVSRYLSSLDVRGVSGKSLREAWDDDDPRAYLGISIPGFPNFLLLGGPNSFPGSGSFTFHMEAQMRYIRALLTEMLSKSLTALDVRQERCDSFNDLVDEIHRETVWTHPGVSTYYKNSRGRVFFVSPFLNVEFWEMTNTVSLDDYERIG